jgi:hypothetical protein
LLGFTIFLEIELAKTYIIFCGSVFWVVVKHFPECVESTNILAGKQFLFSYYELGSIVCVGEYVAFFVVLCAKA